MNCYDLTDGHEPISRAEIDYLKELVRGLPPKPVIVNIGADGRLDVRLFRGTRRRDDFQRRHRLLSAGI